jgi:hypothetical protein
MFEYLEPDAAGASDLPPAQPSQAHPRPERVRHLLYGSLAAIDRTIKILHVLGYAEPNDWSEPLPVPLSGPNEFTAPGNPGRSGSEGPWMVILTKTLRLE